MLKKKIHSKDCSCSWCGNAHDSGLRFGLNLPKVYAWNSWFVIKYWPKHYIRFNLPFLGK